MEKFLKIILTIIIIGIITLIGLGIKQIVIQMHKNNNFGLDGFLSDIENTTHTMKAVIIKVNDKSLMVSSIDNEEAGSIYSCKFAKEGDIGFKMGQEILIYYDGTILTTYPGSFSNVEKIEILKEKSEIEIPEKYMRYCYSTSDNVSISIIDFSHTGISFTITDNNKYKYDISKSYKIVKKNKEIEEENKLIEERNRNALEQQLEKEKAENKEGRNYTTGFTPPETPKQVWEEADKISNITTESTGSYFENGNTHTRYYDWARLYGYLGEGEYKFTTSLNSTIDLVIEIEFSIDEYGKLTYSKPTVRTI